MPPLFYYALWDPVPLSLEKCACRSDIVSHWWSITHWKVNAESGTQCNYVDALVLWGREGLCRCCEATFIEHRGVFQGEEVRTAYVKKGLSLRYTGNNGKQLNSACGLLSQVLQFSITLCRNSYPKLTTCTNLALYWCMSSSSPVLSRYLS